MSLTHARVTRGRHPHPHCPVCFAQQPAPGPDHCPECFGPDEAHRYGVEVGPEGMTPNDMRDLTTLWRSN